MGADVVGWARVHGVRLPGGDVEAVWRLSSHSAAVASELASALGATLESGPAGGAVITAEPVLSVSVSWSAATLLLLRLAQAPEAGRVGLDVAPWTLAEVLGPAMAELLENSGGELRAELVARVIIFQHRGGGYVRHLAPGLRLS